MVTEACELEHEEQLAARQAAAAQSYGFDAAVLTGWHCWETGPSYALSEWMPLTHRLAG